MSHSLIGKGKKSFSVRGVNQITLYKQQCPDFAMFSGIKRSKYTRRSARTILKVPKMDFSRENSSSTALEGLQRLTSLDWMGGWKISLKSRILPPPTFSDEHYTRLRAFAALHGSTEKGMKIDVTDTAMAVPSYFISIITCSIEIESIVCSRSSLRAFWEVSRFRQFTKGDWLVKPFRVYIVRFSE